MSRLFLVLGACLLAVTLTTSTASADAIVFNTDVFADYYAQFFPDSDANGEAILFAPSPTDIIAGEGYAHIQGPGANSDELRSVAISAAFFTLTEPHFYRFAGEINATPELGFVVAFGEIIRLSDGFHIEEFAVGTPVGGTTASWDVSGPAALLPAGDYVVVGGAQAFPDARAGFGFGWADYTFRLGLRPVPEPTSMALLASGALVLFLRRRRKQRIDA